MDSFADIPAEIARRVAGGERVGLILLDAFGLAFLHRHADHPLVARLDVVPLRAQFPSTTTAHVTTVHYGVAVEDHGLYEWNILEPALGEIICPLRFNPAGSDVEGALADRLDPAALAPGPSLYETLDVPSLVLHPNHLGGTRFTALATRGARSAGFGELGEGVRALRDALTGRGAAEPAGYAFLYWDRIDRAGHEHGPDSPEFAHEGRAALDALHAELNGAGRDGDGITVLLCADHGQLAVDPDRVDYLDELWPALPDLLSHARPAGSSRDAFLHVLPGREAEVIDGLAERLGDRARVGPAAELFDRLGPRLRARLGEVAVLPAPGRQAWLRSAAAGERRFRGHHGGLTDAERATYLARLIA